MAIAQHEIWSAEEKYDTTDIITNTNKRDVSEMLDLWVHRKTPFLNYISWGPESGGLSIEWIREHLGYGYMTLGAELTGSTALTAVIAGTADMGGVTGAMKQLNEGALLMGWSSASATHTLWLVNSISLTGELSLMALSDTTTSGGTTVDSGQKLYIIGNFVNEGSEPRADRSRDRVIMTNTMAILRKDVRLTGSMAATDMHAVASELRHQMRLRLLEMQKEREMSCFFSRRAARSTTKAGFFQGILGFLLAETGSHLDSTTTALTESSFNTLIAACWDNGCEPNAVFGSAKQIRKFTEWDRARVRTEPRKNLGGFHVTKYLTDIGIEVDLVPIQHFPEEFLFPLDTEQIKLRAKKGRKLIIEKLGKKGDYDEYQMISEYSLECRGAGNNVLGGMFNHLA